MDIPKIIAQLRGERDCLNEAIVGLEKLRLKREPRRGRPPLWLKLNAVAAVKTENGRP